MTKKVKIEFAPGALEDFEGTQEELDEIVASIEEYVSGEFNEDELAEIGHVVTVGGFISTEISDGDAVSVEAALADPEFKQRMLEILEEAFGLDVDEDDLPDPPEPPTLH